MFNKPGMTTTALCGAVITIAADIIKVYVLGLCWGCFALSDHFHPDQVLQEKQKVEAEVESRSRSRVSSLSDANAAREA